MTAKKPQDHKPKQGEKKEVAIDGITVHVYPQVFDDIDLMDDFYDLQDGKGLPTPVLRKVFGKEYPAVKDALRDADSGRVPVERIADFLTKVISELNPNS